MLNNPSILSIPFLDQLLELLDQLFPLHFFLEFRGKKNPGLWTIAKRPKSDTAQFLTHT
jgi:hypothetical protein